jgi:hypothetical protein
MRKKALERLYIQNFAEVLTLFFSLQRYPHNNHPHLKTVHDSLGCSAWKLGKRTIWVLDSNKGCVCMCVCVCVWIYKHIHVKWNQWNKIMYDDFGYKICSTNIMCAKLIYNKCLPSFCLHLFKFIGLFRHKVKYVGVLLLLAGKNLAFFLTNLL